MKLPIYLDYAATCPVDERVAKKMMEYLTIDGVFGNPASRSHKFGWQAEEAVDIARNQIADLIGADSREIVFTSGATESDNLAIKGAAHFYQTKGKHIITCKTEHKAVLDTCRQLEREGFEVTYLEPESDGLIDLEKFKAALRPDTIVASIMHVNNEIGVIQDIKSLGELCRANKTGKLARVLEVYARRPQVQERLTTQVVEALEEHLNPRGAIVVIEAEHMCMSMRGVRKPGAKTVTSAVRGQLKNAATRAEAMSLIFSQR